MKRLFSVLASLLNLAGNNLHDQGRFMPVISILEKMNDVIRQELLDAADMKLDLVVEPVTN